MYVRLLRYDSDVIILSRWMDSTAKDYLNKYPKNHITRNLAHSPLCPAQQPKRCLWEFCVLLFLVHATHRFNKLFLCYRNGSRQAVLQKEFCFLNWVGFLSLTSYNFWYIQNLFLFSIRQYSLIFFIYLFIYSYFNR